MSPRETRWLTSQFPAHITLNSVKLSHSLTGIDCLCFLERDSFSHFILLKVFHFIKNQLIMLLMLFEVILCFNCWFFTISLNQILVLHWKWLLMFVSLLMMVLCASLSHMSSLLCVAGNWKYCMLLLIYMFLLLVNSSASNFVDLGFSIWKTVWWPCVCPMKQLIASWWYFKTPFC